MELAVYRSSENLRFADLQFIAFPPHHFDENRELQLAASHYLERIGPARFLDSNRNVCQQFSVQSVTQVARGDKRAFASGERRVVDCERHGDGWFINLNVWQRFWIFGTRNGFADSNTLYTRNCQHIARSSERL